MTLLLVGVAVLALTGGLAGLLGRYPRVSALVAISGNAAATLMAAMPCVEALSPGGQPSVMSLPWQTPGGAFLVRLDALSALFTLTILALSLLASIYGGDYMRAHAARRAVGRTWCFFNLLVASMVMVVLAHNGVLFLVAWELMALTSFFLVAFEDEKSEVCRAAWIYLIASHIGAAALLAMFVLLGTPGQSMDFTHFGQGLTPSAFIAVFVLAIVGFGSKAGFAPFHVWLPEAHPAAPSHVSAVMSGLMLKVGIYGLLRILLSLGAPPAWWGWTLIIIGVVSGIGGVLFALAQHDLKRLLAYHSIENIGIIALGLGLGFAAWSAGNSVVCLLAMGGGLLHVVNHALFKSLLFMGAGSVLHATHTRDMDPLGGLLKRMPYTGTTFLAGSMAISGLPPFNGFISEFLIFMAAFRAIAEGSGPLLGPSVTVTAGLALISGLAAACFTKAFGSVFLGEPRSERAHRVRECGWGMRVPMLVLTLACLAIGLGSTVVIGQLNGVFHVIRPDLGDNPADLLCPAVESLAGVCAALGLFLVSLGGLAILRKTLLRRRPNDVAGTWDCGYAAPTARMQYTASSFAQPLTTLFRSVLRTHRSDENVAGLFPKPAAMETHTPDLCMNGLYRPLFLGVERALAHLRWLQHGNIHLYVLYIAVTLVILLLWKLN